MILVDNSKKAGAVAHLVSLPSLECCPPQIQQVFDAQRQTQFCSFVDDGCTCGLDWVMKRA